MLYIPNSNSLHSYSCFSVYEIMSVNVGRHFCVHYITSKMYSLLEMQ